LKRYYTGIGNRSTPTALLPVLTKISQILANKGLILRSGGAEGADEAFEQGLYGKQNE
jgi:predicted Rossmann fold nucleotide-binding protein DprA/Smf involved in DNA uptake